MSLKSFSARNFRCLADIELHNLARVNLLVGDNDTGKTALLEALFAHLSQGNATNLGKLRGFRRSGPVAAEAFWLDLFNGFDEKKEIQLVSVDSSGNQRMNKYSVGPVSQVSLELGRNDGEQGTEKPVAYRPLRVEYSDSKMKEPFVDDVTAEGNRLIQKKKFGQDFRAYYFSTAGPPDLENIAVHVSELFVQKRESLLHALAKIIDDRIERLIPASPKGTHDVFVDLGEPNLVSLTLMGSGVVRAIGIAAAIPNFSSGVVLIDEVEVGIYYKRLKEFWGFLFKLAQTYDVQIFASTHSLECVNAAIAAVAPDLNDSDPLHVYRLERGRRIPIPYESKSLSTAAEFMADVR